MRIGYSWKSDRLMFMRSLANYSPLNKGTHQKTRIREIDIFQYIQPSQQFNKNQQDLEYIQMDRQMNWREHYESLLKIIVKQELQVSTEVTLSFMYPHPVDLAKENEDYRMKWEKVCRTEEFGQWKKSFDNSSNNFNFPAILDELFASIQAVSDLTRLRQLMIKGDNQRQINQEISKLEKDEQRLIKNMIDSKVMKYMSQMNKSKISTLTSTSRIVSQIDVKFKQKAPRQYYYYLGKLKNNQFAPKSGISLGQKSETLDIKNIVLGTLDDERMEDYYQNDRNYYSIYIYRYKILQCIRQDHIKKQLNRIEADSIKEYVQFIEGGLNVINCSFTDPKTIQSYINCLQKKQNSYFFYILNRQVDQLKGEHIHFQEKLSSPKITQLVDHFNNQLRSLLQIQPKFKKGLASENESLDEALIQVLEIMVQIYLKNKLNLTKAWKKKFLDKVKAELQERLDLLGLEIEFPIANKAEFMEIHQRQRPNQDNNVLQKTQQFLKFSSLLWNPIEQEQIFHKTCKISSMKPNERGKILVVGTLGAYKLKKRFRLLSHPQLSLVDQDCEWQKKQKNVKKLLAEEIAKNLYQEEQLIILQKRMGQMKNQKKKMKENMNQMFDLIQQIKSKIQMKGQLYMSKTHRQLFIQMLHSQAAFQFQKITQSSIE